MHSMTQSHRRPANVGDVFGALTVVEILPSQKYYHPKSGSTSHRRVVKVRCACGREWITTAHFLRRRKGHACKNCAYKSRPQSTQKFTAEERMYRMTIVTRANKAGIPVYLSQQEYIEIARRDCHYCGEKPRSKLWESRNRILANRDPIELNGIDRKNSDGPYSVDNCVACCKTCNFMKHDCEYEEFLSHVQRVANHTRNLLMTPEVIEHYTKPLPDSSEIE